MGRDNDDRVFLLVEQDAFHLSRYFANFTAILEVVGQTDRSRTAAKKEKGVNAVDVRVGIDNQRAEHDLVDSSFPLVSADLG